jgi:hypothetical protein
LAIFYKKVVFFLFKKKKLYFSYRSNLRDGESPENIAKSSSYYCFNSNYLLCSDSKKHLLPEKEKSFPFEYRATWKKQVFFFTSISEETNHELQEEDKINRYHSVLKLNPSKERYIPAGISAETSL